MACECRYCHDEAIVTLNRVILGHETIIPISIFKTMLMVTITAKGRKLREAGRGQVVLLVRGVVKREIWRKFWQTRLRMSPNGSSHSPTDASQCTTTQPDNPLERHPKR